MVTPEVMGQLKDGFWEAVADCLVEFHGMPRAEAAPKARELRALLDWGPASPSYPDIIYHDEPFYIANRAMQRELQIDDFHEAYYHILARRVGRDSGIVVTEVPLYAAR